MLLHKQFNTKIEEILYEDKHFNLKNIPLIPEVKSVIEKTLYKDHIRRWDCIKLINMFDKLDERLNAERIFRKMKLMPYKLDLTKYIWYSEADTISNTQPDPEVQDIYSDMLKSGCEGKIIMEGKIKKKIMSTLESKKFDCIGAMTSKLLTKEIAKDVGSGHNISE